MSWTGQVVFDFYRNEFRRFIGDEWGYTDIPDKELLNTIAAFTAGCQVLFLDGKSMIGFVRKYGVKKIRATSEAVGVIGGVRDLESDIRLLDLYKNEKSNNPKKIGTKTVALRKKGRDVLVKELNAANKKLTKEQREIYKKLKTFLA